MKISHDNLPSSERIIKKSDREWEFVERPFPPKKLLWIMEHLKGLDCKILLYWQCKLRLPQTLSVLRDFLNFQDQLVNMSGRWNYEEEEQCITKAGHVYAKWLCEWSRSRSDSPLEILPIPFRILQVSRLRDAFSMAVLQAMEHLAGTFFIDHVRDFLVLCRERLENPQHKGSGDLCRLFDRIYLPQAGIASETGNLSEQLMFLEQIEPVARNTWRLKDLPQSRQVFYGMIDAIYKKGGGQILRYATCNIDVGRVWKAWQELLKKQRHAISAFSKFEENVPHCEKRLHGVAVEIGEAYAKLMLSLEDMHSYAGPYLRYVDRVLLDHAGFRQTMLVAFREKIFDQEDRLRDFGFLKTRHQMTLNFVRFLKSSGI